MKSKVSIILPVYNQYFSLLQTLKGLNSQQTTVDFEIIIVDDGSTDELAYIDEISVPKAEKCKIVHQKNFGRAIARNTGIRYSNAEILVFCDGDRVPSPHFVEEHFISQASGAPVVIGAPFEYFGKKCVWESNELDWAAITRFSREAFYFRRAKKIYNECGKTLSEQAYLTLLIGNTSINKKVFENVGGFDRRFKEWGFEHYELGYRIQKAGYKFLLNRNAINYHIPHVREKRFYENNVIKNIDIIKHIHPEIDTEIIYRIFINKEPF